MPVFLLGFLGFGKTLFQGVIAWLSKRSLAEIICIALGLALAVDHIALLASHRHTAKVEAQLAKAVKARLDDRAAYVKAQLDAATKNKAQVAAVEAQQQKVTDNVEARYRADLERLRAASAAPQRPSGKPGSPAPSPATSGSGCEALPLSGPELLSAQETELQLNALIDWVNQQTAIDPNKP